MNLCTNAAYAMREEGGKLEISLGAITLGPDDSLPEADTAPGDYVVISVRDSGPGMSEAVKQRIFEPFFTTKPRGQGSGLGLSVVYGIVKSHKGSIMVLSEPDRGAVFRSFSRRPHPKTLSRKRFLNPSRREVKESCSWMTRKSWPRWGGPCWNVLDIELSCKRTAPKPCEISRNTLISSTWLLQTRPCLE